MIASSAAFASGLFSRTSTNAHEKRMKIEFIVGQLDRALDPLLIAGLIVLGEKTDDKPVTYPFLELRKSEFPYRLTFIIFQRMECPASYFRVDVLTQADQACVKDSGTDAYRIP